MPNLFNLVFDSKALSIWNAKTGPAFWWTSNLPAPFYLRTEIMIGRDLADKLLEMINDVLARYSDAKTRATQLNAQIMAAYKQHTDYQIVVRAMVEKAKNEFPDGSYASVSGGERRDWLFSIPFAAEIGIKHVYLFKDKTAYCDAPLQQGETVLHVADIIAKAASYFNLWLPALEKVGLTCVGTVTVNAHQAPGGVKRLEQAGYKVAPVNLIDFSFFQNLRDAGLIENDRLEEIAVYFRSEKEWVDRYLLRDAALCSAANLDPKSTERMKVFFEHDPWELYNKHQALFDALRASLATS